jgi:hypothetical protein
MNWRVEYNKKQFEKAKKELQMYAKNVKKSCDEKALVEFYCICCNFGYRFSNMISSTEIEQLFKEALQEVV